MSEQNETTSSEETSTTESPAETLYPSMKEGGDTDAERGSEAVPAEDESKAEESAAEEKTEAEAEAKPEAKAEEKKADDEAEAEDESSFKPITASDLEIPKDFEIPESRQSSMVDFINEHKIPPEAVQEFLKLNADWAKDDAEAGVKAWTETQEEWVSKAEADPHIGGEKLEPALEGVQTLIDVMTEFPDAKGEMVADEEYRQGLKDVFTLTGAGNHPLMIRFLSDVAQQARVHEGKPLVGGRAQAEPNPLATLYPTMKTG